MEKVPSKGKEPSPFRQARTLDPPSLTLLNKKNQNLILLHQEEYSEVGSYTGDEEVGVLREDREEARLPPARAAIV